MAISEQVLLFRKHIQPSGDQDGVNTVFQAPERFDPETIELFLSGNFLRKDIDFEVLPGNRKVKILLDPNDATRLSVPPLQDEPLVMNYLRE